MSTSDVHNKGILHLRVGEKIYCGQKRAIMALPLDEYRKSDLQKCAKCQASVDKFDARKKNPRLVANPYQVNKADVDKAYKLYREFRESPPDRGRVVEFEMPKTLMVMGNVKAIEYDTTRGRKLELYRHDFAAGSRPLLCADAATGALFIIEGRYRVTKRGIVDIDPNGKEIDD